MHGLRGLPALVHVCPVRRLGALCWRGCGAFGDRLANSILHGDGSLCCLLGRRQTGSSGRGVSVEKVVPSSQVPWSAGLRLWLHGRPC